MNSEEILHEVASQINVCERCGLCKTRINAVPGTGLANAEILFIGEGPGQNEDAKGLPFIGAAGQFLTAMLKAAGYERSSVFITNVVKCRPPGNRDPLPEELAACSGYLDRQIVAINPTIIVTLGRFSMARYFSNVRISDVHGRPKMVEGRLIVPMFHPAAALHQPPLRKTIEQDFARLPHWIAKMKEKLANEKNVASAPVQPTKPDEEEPKQLPLFG